MMMIWKILVGGEGGVGKTAIINRYINDIFNFDVKMTIGVAFVIKEIQMDGQKIQLQIWDLGGQDRFRFVLPGYCKGGRGGFILYDASDLETLALTTNWFTLFTTNAPGIPIVLVGTKIDLIKGDGEMDRAKEAASKVATDYGCIGSILTSSKLGINVNEAMDMLVKHMVGTCMA